MAYWEVTGQVFLAHGFTKVFEAATPSEAGRLAMAWAEKRAWTDADVQEIVLSTVAPAGDMLASEFPDYPAEDVPPIPPGFIARHWHNDACPSWLNEAADLTLMVDYLDPAQREVEGMRFVLHRDGAVLFETDDWAAMAAEIARRHAFRGSTEQQMAT